MSDPYQSQTLPEPQTMPEQQSSGGNGKCLLFGCLGVFALLLLVCGGGTFGSYWYVKSQVAKYTSESGADIPVVELAEEQVEEIKTRTNTFRETIENGQTPEPLILTAEEINGMIADDENMRGRVFIKIEDGNVTGDVSIPADLVPGGAGRFFNASATFDVSIDNGFLEVRLVDATVKGEAMPDQFIDAIGRENLAKDVGRNNPEVADFLRHMESLTVEDDKIILTPRTTTPTREIEQTTPPQEEPADSEAPQPAATN